MRLLESPALCTLRTPFERGISVYLAEPLWPVDLESPAAVGKVSARLSQIELFIRRYHATNDAVEFSNSARPIIDDLNRMFNVTSSADRLNRFLLSHGLDRQFAEAVAYVTRQEPTRSTADNSRSTLGQVYDYTRQLYLMLDAGEAKYLAHQFVVLYQMMGSLSTTVKLKHFRNDIEKNFDLVKSSEDDPAVVQWSLELLRNVMDELLVLSAS